MGYVLTTQGGTLGSRRKGNIPLMGTWGQALMSCLGAVVDVQAVHVALHPPLGDLFSKVASTRMGIAGGRPAPA